MARNDEVELVLSLDGSSFDAVDGYGFEFTERGGAPVEDGGVNEIPL